MGGYYKLDELNSDVIIFTEDRWIRTGDVGQWNKDRTLRLIDQTSSSFQTGKYIALERLEPIYNACNLVGNIYVHATSYHKEPWPSSSHTSIISLLQAVVLTLDEWTPESGLVTAAQKIQRSKIAKGFEASMKEALVRPANL
ncbi:hypothetical protein BDQ12DRAFT_700793 [Crucibulum laeve]|uniref:AMP-dependent synthetase/ligase domain-containing protein n=1 Tax=Crucibulum laeve TaxID=68775 RepID=A0A5C3LKY8_9AGAR|nr:hypothetical protein BDQ12DRAFT_700793 [Crucibulum laeve]